MGLFKNIWIVAFLALFINLGLTGGLILYQVDAIVGIPAEDLINTVPEGDDNYVFWSFRTSELEKLINEIRAERERLDQREETIAEMETRLKAEQVEVRRLRREVERAREELRGLIVEVEEDELANLKDLATTYSQVDPAAAVTVFSQMEDDFVVKILALMKADSVSPIFEEMVKNPNDSTMAERVARLSEKLRMKRQQ